MLILLFSSAVTDGTRKKIYNIQTYPAMLCGLVLGYLYGEWPGLLMSFAGLLVGLALLFAVYLIGGIGAGDVKLLGAIGALQGTTFVLWTMFYTALVGGAMAFAVIIWQGTARQTLKNIIGLCRHPLQQTKNTPAQDSQYLPYGIAIAAGGLWAFCLV
ncbi:MAG: hypothetical protein GY868_06545 [Deltaproteobacteria bacterium]|nr:hypothetical protein [Deltaproteobacteria bacterium]